MVREYERNRERYMLLRWAQKAFDNFSVVPPSTGIVHQVNIEYLARVVQLRRLGDDVVAFPDTLVGTDSHTTMVNAMGVLGWGVGGIEAEAVLLGQPLYLLAPEVIGFGLHGQLPEGTTATDLVLMVTQMLRKHGVVGKFVEFYGRGLSQLTLADRATLSNMAPEYGATASTFPVDEQTLQYLRGTGRPAELISLVERYTKEQGMFRTDASPAPEFSEVLELDLSTVEPSLAGPRRPHDRVNLAQVSQSFRSAFPQRLVERRRAARRGGAERLRAAERRGRLRHAARHRLGRLGGDRRDHLLHEHLQPDGDDRRRAAGEEGGRARSERQAVRQDEPRPRLPGGDGLPQGRRPAGLPGGPALPPGRLRLHHLHRQQRRRAGERGPRRRGARGGAAGLGRAQRQPQLRGPHPPPGARPVPGFAPLVVAYALAGTVDIDLSREPIGNDPNGQPVYLRDIWPTAEEVRETLERVVKPELFQEAYAHVFDGDEAWQSLPVPEEGAYEWDPASTYIQEPPFFQDLTPEPAPLQDIEAARVLVVLGDSVNTDGISPASAIPVDSPTGKYLIEHGVQPRDFNQYGARRGNHEVMMRGTFGNIRLRNELVGGKEGDWTVYFPTGEQMRIYDASQLYQAAHTPLLVIAGKEYGSGSSRDWAAKGTLLLGVKAVLVELFERIHRSNLVGMGVLPLEFRAGESRQSLGLDGTETYSLSGIAEGLTPRKELEVRVQRTDGSRFDFKVIARVDSQVDIEYLRNGGILHTVLRQMLSGKTGAATPA